VRKVRRPTRAARTPWGRVIRHVQESSSLKATDNTESGFSLLELMIVSLVLPIIIGAITLALMAVFSLQGGTANRISDSSDAQTVSANFEKDVQGASLITTNGTSTGPSPCETSSQLSNGDRQVLGLQWGSGQTEASYVEVPVGTSSNELVRNGCQSGNTTPVTTSVVANDVPSGQSATVTCASSTATECTGSTNVTNSWIPAADVIGVTFNITAPGSNFPYTLVALPGASSPASPQSTVASANSGCGFSTPGTGTYASALCFVDFNAYNGSPTSCPGSPGYQEISAPIANTPYTMTFCLNVSGASVSAHAIPTYFAPPTSEAFLGNNGFTPVFPVTRRCIRRARARPPSPSSTSRSSTRTATRRRVGSS
jgi:prepilin-type N-terminal cleavage/methylation domain-containing protein